MGVSTTTNRGTYLGNGSTQAFSFPYYTFFQTDLLVYVYDTLLGGVTPYYLGSGFTVSGTANFQGIYPNGVTVTFASYVPLSTDIVVIIRNPNETQTFNIIENGVIPSSTLIQQLDYLTLLIQRLEDQATRSIMLADGTGASFNPALPSNIALSPNTYLQVNSNGNGLVLNQNLNLVGWQSAVVPFISLSAAALTNQFVLFSLPAGYVLTGLFIKHSASFTGSGITDCYAQLGISSNYQKFIADFDVYQAVADQAFDGVLMNYVGSWANATNIYLQLVSVGANLSALTTGSVTIYYQIQNVL